MTTTDRPWSVLSRHVDFRRLFIGSSISLLGSSVTLVALPLTAVVYLKASPAEMGLLGALALLPHLVLGIPVGVWVNQWPYRRILIVTDITQAILLGLVPVLAALGVLAMWHLYAVVLLTGVAGLFETVTAQSFTPRLVRRDQLLPANSTLMLSNTTVNTTGSALGGLLVSALSAPLALIVDAASFVASALCKSRIREAGRNPAPAAQNKQHLAGLRTVFAHRILRPVILAAGVGAFAGQAQTVVLVLYLVRDVGLPSGLIGLLIAFSGIAGVAGAAVATRVTRWLGPGPAFTMGMFLSAAGGVVLAGAVGSLVTAFAILMVAQFLRGVGPSLYGVNQQTFRQTLVPADMLSQVNATWRFLIYGGMSLGALLGGLIGTVLGLRLTLVATSCLMLLGAGIAWSSPVRELREL
ncbi:MFS transporter [Streptosporangium sandarakinum]|uniref:MFS transporter n=1 Tax=Streptosporangium sandarakinum TaxID=1260955 RepID=UPI003426EA19